MDNDSEQSRPTTVREIIGLWPSCRVLAEDLADFDVKTWRVQKWAQANSIPQFFHRPILRAAQKRQISLTADDIIDAHHVVVVAA